MLDSEKAASRPSSFQAFWWRWLTMDKERWYNLEVWKHADQMALSVYRATKTFPKEEIYGVTSQIRRAALSIPANIVEGYSRKGDKELQRFVNISLGSLAETKYLIYFSERLGYLSQEKYQELKSGYDKLGNLLWGFYRAINEEDAGKLERLKARRQSPPRSQPASIRAASNGAGKPERFKTIRPVPAFQPPSVRAGYKEARKAKGDKEKRRESENA